MTQNWLPSLNALRALEAVARHMSFQKAADELHVTAPAIQQLVRGLETTLAHSLVVRKGRTVTVSKVASVAIPYLREGFDQLSRGVRKIREQSGHDQIIVTVEPSFASSWLIGRLSKFYEANPNVDILIDASTKLFDLERSEAHVAIRYCLEPRPTNLIAHCLFHDQTIAVCSPKLIPRDQTKIEIGNLKLFPLIHFECDQKNRRQPNWEQWMISVGHTFMEGEHNIRFTDYNSVLQSAIAGHGIALASKPLVQEAIDLSLLVNPLDLQLHNSFGYYVLCTPDSFHRREVQLFVEWMQDEACPLN